MNLYQTQFWPNFDQVSYFNDHTIFKLLYGTAVEPRGLDYIFDVKNRINKKEGVEDLALSIRDLLASHTTENLQLEKIEFKIYEFKMPSELKKLADYLIDPVATQNAIALLRSSDPRSNIQHAVLLYDYDDDERCFYYKDSDAKAYSLLNQSDNIDQNYQEIRLPWDHAQQKIQFAYTFYYNF